MKLRLARPERLIDIARLGEPGACARLLGGLAIGALRPTRSFEDEVIGRFGVFADALPRIGDVQVRNRGTIGGSVAHADPAADLPPVLLALDAVLVIRSAGRGERTIEVADFFEGAFTTALAEDELLTEIRLPAPSGGGDRRTRRSSSGPLATRSPASRRSWVERAAARATARCVARRTRVGPRPARGHRRGRPSLPRDGGRGAALAGTNGDDAALEAALAHVTDGMAVGGDIHADAEYRTAMTGRWRGARSSWRAPGWLRRGGSAMREPLETLDAWRAEGADVGRAVVIRTFGSAPRPEAPSSRRPPTAGSPAR